MLPRPTPTRPARPAMASLTQRRTSPAASPTRPATLPVRSPIGQAMPPRPSAKARIAQPAGSEAGWRGLATPSAKTRRVDGSAKLPSKLLADWRAVASTSRKRGSRAWPRISATGSNETRSRRCSSVSALDSCSPAPPRPGVDRMATDLQTPENAGLTGLVTGIANDAQNLLKQQLALFRSELKQDFRQTREMASSFVVGGVLALVAAGLLTTMLVFLVQYLTNWHLAGCYALVGGIVAAIAGFFIWRAIETLERFKPLDQTAEAIQENLEWKTNETRR